MGFDLVIASGEDNRIMGDPLLGCLVEVRVEQKLDEPTKFAVRFLEDIQDGQPQKARQPELKLEQIITIAVRDGDDLACLCRGPVLERQAEMTQGGPGSWFEIRGLDRRDLLAREYREGSWAGRASDAAATILAPVYPNVSLDSTEKVYDFDNDPLPQRGTDLEFLKKNAVENGYHFWIGYEGVSESLTGALTLLEKANWKASPPLGDAPPAGLPSLPLGDDAITLRFNVPQNDCPNLTKLQLSEDSAQPSAVRTSTQNETDGGQDPLTTTDQAAPLGGAGQGVGQVGTARFMPPQPQGDGQDARTISEAALREAGFFVKAEISTTRHLLKRVLEPHQVVAIEGLGGANAATPFRVAEVVHVINGAEHYMDAMLETNAQVAV